MNNKVTCRPCKEEQGTWEIEDQNGQVLPKHYVTKEACVKAGRTLAEETSCELHVCDHTQSSK